MKKKFKLLITFGILVLLVGGLYFFSDWFSKVTGSTVGEDEIVKLVKCLDKQGVEFYGNSNCPDCQKQKDLFGQYFKRISYVNCGENLELCSNLREIPAWYINETFEYGFKNFGELGRLGGCESYR